jgi:vacuolar-type H+-ATPase subunit C/Vma6
MLQVFNEIHDKMSPIHDKMSPIHDKMSPIENIEGIKTIPQGMQTIPNENTPLKNSIVNNQSTQHIKEKLYKYDKSFYENYLSIKNKKEDTDTPTDNIV